MRVSRVFMIRLSYLTVQYEFALVSCSRCLFTWFICHKCHKCLFTASHSQLKHVKLLPGCQHDIRMPVFDINQLVINVIMEAENILLSFFKKLCLIYLFCIFFFISSLCFFVLEFPVGVSLSDPVYSLIAEHTSVPPPPNVNEPTLWVLCMVA